MKKVSKDHQKKFIRRRHPFQKSLFGEVKHPIRILKEHSIVVMLICYNWLKQNNAFLNFPV